MNFGGSSKKIADIVDTVKNAVSNIEEIKAKYVDKINEYIGDLETALNSKGDKSDYWVDTQVEKTTKKINDTLTTVQTKLTNMISGLDKWYDKQIKSVKRSIIKANFAKLGQDCSNEMADTMADAIPHPKFSSFIPKIDLSLDLPDASQLEKSGKVKLPRLEI